MTSLYCNASTSGSNVELDSPLVAFDLCETTRLRRERLLTETRKTAVLLSIFLFSELVNLHFNKSITRIVINPATSLNQICSSNTKEKAISAENA